MNVWAPSDSLIAKGATRLTAPTRRLTPGGFEARLNRTERCRGEPFDAGSDGRQPAAVCFAPVTGDEVDRFESRDLVRPGAAIRPFAENIREAFHGCGRRSRDVGAPAGDHRRFKRAGGRHFFEVDRDTRRLGIHPDRDQPREDFNRLGVGQPPRIGRGEFQKQVRRILVLRRDEVSAGRIGGIQRMRVTGAGAVPDREFPMQRGGYSRIRVGGAAFVVDGFPDRPFEFGARRFDFRVRGPRSPGNSFTSATSTWL